MAALVAKNPGFRASKDFVAEDGERLALIEFEGAEELRLWREEPDHQRAQAEGRERWYSGYQLQVCAVLRESRFDGAAVARHDADPATLRDIARRWLACFARQDVDTLVGLYAEDAVHTSPKIRALHPDTGGMLRGKAALRAWWADAFVRLPKLSYELTGLTADSERVFLEYVRHVPGEADMTVAEVLEVRDGLIIKSRVFHG
jgi:ketosteroid isomerase-like protein/heme-degrading monooxygenase HmoA